jgi:hypothetical protein
LAHTVHLRSSCTGGRNVRDAGRPRRRHRRNQRQVMLDIDEEIHFVHLFYGLLFRSSSVFDTPGTTKVNRPDQLWAIITFYI